MTTQSRGPPVNLRIYEGNEQLSQASATVAQPDMSENNQAYTKMQFSSMHESEQSGTCQNAVQLMISRLHY